MDQARPTTDRGAGGTVSQVTDPPGNPVAPPTSALACRGEAAPAEGIAAPTYRPRRALRPLAPGADEGRLSPWARHRRAQRDVPVPTNPTPRWQPTFRLLRVDGVAIRVGFIGDGPPLLLINGIGANMEMWEALASRLPGRRVVMFDFPGTGASPPMQGRVRMPGLARLVVRLLDELEIGCADVLGYSWGGALAQQLAYQAPQRVRSLVLAATVPGIGGQPPAPWVVAAMATPTRYYSPTYLRVVAPMVFGTIIRPDEAHVKARLDRPPSLRGYSHQLYAISGWSSRPWLHRLRMPVLVLTGKRDRLSPSRNGRILAHDIHGARLQVLPGGHLFLLQRPDAAARAITAFLDAQEVRGSRPVSPAT